MQRKQKYNPFANLPADPYERMRTPRRNQPAQSNGNVAVQGVVDVAKIAVVGGVTVGLLGAVGGMFPRG